MKTVIINGSPRKNGDTAALISHLKKGLHGEIVQFDAYDSSIRPCIDCRACRNGEQCPIQDAFPKMLSAINEADVIVLASPVYFSELTGPLLSVASRLQFAWIAESVHHQPVITKKARQGIILLSGGGLGAPHRALDTAACILRQMGAHVIGSVCSLQTDELPAAQDETAKMQIDELISKL